GRRELAHEIDDHVATRAERAGHADLGLIEQVAVRGIEHREADTADAVPFRVATDPGRREAVGEDVAAGVEEGRGKDGLAHVGAPAVVTLEAGRGLVGGLGARRYRPTPQRGTPGEVALGPGQG